MNRPKNGDEKRWLKFLTEREGYDKASARSAAKKLVKLDARVKSAFEAWAETGIVKDVSISGADFTARELMEQLGFQPVAAYLLMDWLIREPDAAKRALAGGADKVIIDAEFLRRMDEAGKLDDAEHCGYLE